VTAASAASDTAPLPERGGRVMLDGLPGGPWSTVVVGVAADTLALAAPRLGGRVVRLPLRRAFVVAYTHREIPCEVDAELVEGPGPGSTGPYVARVTGAPRRIQRRRAVRVPVHLMAQADLGDDVDGAPLRAVTENLSAGGALLRAARPIDAGGHVEITIQCGGEAGTLELTANVVRCDHTSSDARPWRVALAFLDMPATDEDRLVRFLFERQRELRARDTGLS